MEALLVITTLLVVLGIVAQAAGVDSRDMEPGAASLR